MAVSSIVAIGVQAPAASAKSFKTIVLGADVPETGPAASVLPLALGAAAYLDSVNAAGGVNGYKFKYDLVDDQYNPALAESAARLLVLQDHVFAMLDDIGANTQQAIKPFLLANGVPSIGPASSDPNTSDALTYMVGATADTDGAYQMTYAINNLAGGKPVGVLYQNDAVGDPYFAAYQQAAAQLAWPITAEPFPTGTTDFTAEITALQQAGVKVVLIAASASALLPAMTTANSIGFTPDWVVTGYDTTASLLKSLPSAQEANMYFSTSVPLFGTSVTAPLQAALTKYEPSVAMGIDPEIGWTVASVFMAAFKKMTTGHKVAKHKGLVYQAATRKGLVKALDSFKNFSNSLIKDVTYAPGKGVTLPHVDRPEEAMIAVRNGNLAIVAPFSQPPRLQGTGTQ